MLDWLRKLMPKEDAFFGLFERHAALIRQAADRLQAMIEGHETVAAGCEAISRLEEQADELTREAMLAVRRTFITPFDRSDIQGLVTALDDTIDQMQKTARTALLFETTTFGPEMAQVAKLIVEAAAETDRAMPLLRGMSRNAGALTEIAERIVALEGRADEAHNAGLKSLYRTSRTDPMAFIVGADLHDHLEKVMDRFEDVADRVSGILVEHL